MRWDADTFISLAQGLVTLLMAAAGYFVSTRPVVQDRRKRKIAEAFFIVLGITLFILIGAQSVRALHAKRRSDKQLAASQARLNASFGALLKSNAETARVQGLNVQLLKSLLDSSHGITTTLQQQHSELDQQSQSLQTIVKTVGAVKSVPRFSRSRSIASVIATADYKIEPLFLQDSRHVPHGYVFTPSISPPSLASSYWVSWDFGDDSPNEGSLGLKPISHVYKDDKPYVVKLRLSPVDDW